jgi:hypothetical protein
MTTIYVTRYALSRGIIRTDAELLEGGTALVRLNPARAAYLAPKDFTLTAEEAITRGEAMRERRIANLRKQLRQLEGHGIELVDSRAR